MPAWTGTRATRCSPTLQVSYYVANSFGTQMYNSCKVSRVVLWQSTAVCWPAAAICAANPQMHSLLNRSPWSPCRLPAYLKGPAGHCLLLPADLQLPVSSVCWWLVHGLLGEGPPLHRRLPCRTLCTAP